MKLTMKDKSELISYRNNVYCLINLNNHPGDLEGSKRRFIEQSQLMYTLEKDK